jgi:hypothetical protein
MIAGRPSRADHWPIVNNWTNRGQEEEMYQHPATMELMAHSHQQDLLHEAEQRRLARQLHSADGTARDLRVHRLAAAAVAVLTVFGVIAIL